MKKNLNIGIFICGSISLTAALGNYYIEGAFGAFSLFLLAFGLICLFWFFIVAFKRSDVLVRLKNRKRFFWILFVFLIFFFLIVEINYLGRVYNRRVDLTLQKQHTLNKQTLQIIGALKEPIELRAFYVGIAPVYIQDMLKEFQARSNGMITTEIIDPLQNIGYASQFDSKISGKEQKLIVTSTRDRRDIDFHRRILSEEEIVNAILRVTRKKRKAYFLTGHREYRIEDSQDKGLSVFKALLANNQVESEELLLITGKKVPADCDLLIIAGPQEFLTKEEEDTIEQYLEDGGDALFLIENTVVTTPDKTLTEEEKKKNPALNEILEKWGVKVNYDIVVDLSNHASGDVGSPATRNYMPHKALIKDLDYTFYVRPRSISMLRNRAPNLKVAPFVLTSSSGKYSWAESNRNLIVKFDEGDKPGPVPISYVIWRENKGESDTRIIVFSDADFLTNAFISQYSNSLMGLNVVNWLTEVDYQAFLEKQVKTIPKLELTSKQKRMVTVILFIMPLFISIMGISVWLKRRN